MTIELFEMIMKWVIFASFTMYINTNTIIHSDCLLNDKIDLRKWKLIMKIKTTTLGGPGT